MHNFAQPVAAGITPRPFKAPGVIWKKKKRERVPVWIASRRARDLGFEPKTQRLWGDAAAVLARAMALTAEEKSWLRNYLTPRRPPIARFRDRMDDMLDLYQDHDASNFSELEPRTQKNYIYLLDCLRKDIGSERVSHLTKLDVDGWYRKFRKPSKPRGDERIAQAHALMGMLRTVAAFCTGLYPNSDKLRAILSSMQFENAQPRTAYVTAEMAIAFRREAHRRGRRSQALATALQFETGLRQGDVIGVWQPHLISGENARAQFRAGRHLIWCKGLVWEEHISAVLILEKPTNKSNRRKTAMADLNMCEMVVEELQHVAADERYGPVIFDEDTGEPYLDYKFRRVWREIADAAGIPKEVKNMDNRAGGVTEGSDAEAPDEHLRAFATHSSFKMTRRYNRATLHKSQTVHALRADLRKRRRTGQIVEHERPAIEHEHATE